MMDGQLKTILDQLKDHEQRILALEGRGVDSVESTAVSNNKQLTLRELVKGRKLKNGQEAVAIIVGYYEKMLHKLISFEQIRVEWDNAKMTNVFNTVFIKRAKEDLIRIHPNKTCDLTQSGEEFFESFLKNGSASQPSK